MPTEQIKPRPTHTQTPTTMPALTLNQAAKAANKSKSTLLDALSSGRLSGAKNELGQWQIDPAELFRVYPSDLADRTYKTETDPSIEPQETDLLLRKEQEERARERLLLENQISDLREQRDSYRSERDKLLSVIQEQAATVKQLTHQPEIPSENSRPLYERPGMWLWLTLAITLVFASAVLLVTTFKN